MACRRLRRRCRGRVRRVGVDAGALRCKNSMVVRQSGFALRDQLAVPDAPEVGVAVELVELDSLLPALFASGLLSVPAFFSVDPVCELDPPLFPA